MNGLLKIKKQQKDHKTIIDFAGSKIGNGNFVVIAGPCAVESQEQMFMTAKVIQDMGTIFMRGGTFKPRTNPYSFQGLGIDGLGILEQAKKKYNVIVSTEVMSTEMVDVVSRNVDILQIGSRNMQNFDLLKKVGKTSLPVILKRGLSATIEEWLAAAEYIMCEGNRNVILCERGIRTFEKYTRNTLDLSAVLAVKQLSHLPVIVDPSHGTGRSDMILPMAKAAMAIGADGIMIEIHPNPGEALSDGDQSINFAGFTDLIGEVQKLKKVFNYC
ncbi:bifunctional 3-deoxy-7-phosphoheptulonate synthase/chorismate mutase|uniref:3-deoxy-D-arabinoheptulosonate-7-phosphate synthase n=1 Tax=Dendrosporobacter quercicolus TaxID=146817 RepID=A0A1G9RP79_9FIRM|nr:bifunctional 3-deoxy-7-phosphoheptulonate synthase/chorismate mutase [Dendrosporobacter quercicolus]NSL49386.1 bifunctional 3-deoxy-7-phosphoheptulonate synthase/chorismate mutase [Dendrosporobacter quercicolus DSM 1736]SDM25139.1 3-deoxy-D-arabinoheptulosonate-7-phosphate synthase [Dendrosporobacter quercicolus]